VGFDLLTLAGITTGFSGAEIEQAIVAATYLAREQGNALSTEHLRTEIEQTRPLSQVMAENMARLRNWARDRTVPAN
jgi:SpoVK/Ycf46/Vps4 family AAA+-type ATPase